MKVSLRSKILMTSGRKLFIVIFWTASVAPGRVTWCISLDISCEFEREVTVLSSCMAVERRLWNMSICSLS
ncbi:hypothetical protein C8R46DRAFT_1121006 [Mycena filopes]|nr:hypothetical protein C8R46DRAFT_1121006 [Mycena filopes]